MRAVKRKPNATMRPLRIWRPVSKKRREDKEKCVLVAPSSNKRKHSQLISTPMSQANHIHALVKSLFHFVVHLERKHERFFLKDALAHGYMRESGGKLEIDEADKKSRNRIQFLDLSKASATREFVGNSTKKTYSAWALLLR